MLAMVLAALLMVALVSTSGVGTALAQEDGTIGTMGIVPADTCGSCGGKSFFSAVAGTSSEMKYMDCTKFAIQRDAWHRGITIMAKKCSACGTTKSTSNQYGEWKGPYCEQ